MKIIQSQLLDDDFSQPTDFRDVDIRRLDGQLQEIQSSAAAASAILQRVKMENPHAGLTEIIQIQDEQGISLGHHLDNLGLTQ